MKINKKQINKKSALKTCKINTGKFYRITAILLSMNILGPNNYTYKYSDKTKDVLQCKIDLRQEICDRREEIQQLSANDLEVLLGTVRTRLQDPYSARLIQDIWNMNRANIRDINHVQQAERNVGMFGLGTKAQKGAMIVDFNQSQFEAPRFELLQFQNGQFQMPGAENFLANSDRYNNLISAFDYAFSNQTLDQNESTIYTDEIGTLDTESTTLSQYVKNNKTDSSASSETDDLSLYMKERKIDYSKTVNTNGKILSISKNNQSYGEYKDRKSSSPKSLSPTNIDNNTTIKTAIRPKKGIDLRNPTNGQNPTYKSSSKSYKDQSNNQGNGCESSCSA